MKAWRDKIGQVMKRLAVLQSNYIPWKGYFDIIQRVETFVFYDDVQYTKNDWRNRNRIKTSNGLNWLTVPTGGNLGRRICDVEITDSHWQKKHFRTLQQSYSKSPFFETYREFLEAVYLDQCWENLSELNQYMIQRIATEFLGITTEFRNASEFQVTGSGSERLLKLVSNYQADVYVSGPAAKDYLDEQEFNSAGIAVEYMNYDGYPKYPQLHPPFCHEVSILDLLFHVGPDAPKYITPSCTSHNSNAQQRVLKPESTSRRSA